MAKETFNYSLPGAEVFQAVSIFGKEFGRLPRELVEGVHKRFDVSELEKRFVFRCCRLASVGFFLDGWQWHVFL